MQASMLIERIVRQTTVLIAQLSTAAGIRAPLAHIADQVFVALSRELEQQGVGRKVAADMFGLALRTYQRKVQRLSESASQRSATLWEAVLEHIRENEGISRPKLEQRFAYDDPEQVAAVLADLVASGLVYASGKGGYSIYRVTSAEERRSVAASSELDAVTGLAWLTLFRNPAGLTFDQLVAELAVEADVVRRGLEQLIADGRVERSPAASGERYRAGTFLIPLGAERGWEAAVCDHFTAVASAIAAKLAHGVARSTASDVVGGATYAFDIHDEHPLRERVLSLLRDERARISAFWDEVHAHNLAHPADDALKSRVTFYFGQHVIEADRGEAGPSVREPVTGEST
jgi:hypothetical protein